MFARVVSAEFGGDVLMSLRGQNYVYKNIMFLIFLLRCLYLHSGTKTPVGKTTGALAPRQRHQTIVTISFTAAHSQSENNASLNLKMSFMKQKNYFIKSPPLSTHPFNILCEEMGHTHTTLCSTPRYMVISRRNPWGI